MERVERRSYQEQNIVAETSRYGESLTKHRLGQGAFRVVVTDAYQRRCAITGEKTLPVLEAAHIKPYAQEGPHDVKNGLLLRSDMHTLYDDGYITIDTDYKIDVSKRLHEDYGNGKDYYKYQVSDKSVSWSIRNEDSSSTVKATFTEQTGTTCKVFADNEDNIGEVIYVVATLQDDSSVTNELEMTITGLF